MKKLTKLVNNFFIDIILFLFYFLVIGFASIIYKFIYLLGKHNKDSYWIEGLKKNYSKEYFSSPY